MKRTRANAVVLGIVFSFAAAISSAQSAPLTAASKPTIAVIPSPLSVEVRPMFDMPIADTAQWFSYGGGVDLGVNYKLPRSIFFLTGGMEYSFAPDLASTSLSLLAARVGGGVQIPLTSGVSVLGYAAGGYYLATYNDFSASASDPYVAGGLGVRFSLGPTLRLDVGAQYRYLLGLYQGVSAGAGIDVALGNLGGSVDVPSLELRPAFPVFYKYYDDHPVGTLEIKSKLNVPATDIRAQVYIKEFMDAPKAVSVPGILQPGETRKIDLYALFTDKVLGITEGTKVAAEVTVSYSVEGQGYENKRIETMSLLGRNAMTWDDNRKAAAYVTAKEPQVLNFARSVTSYVHSKENRSISDNLQAVIALHEALDLYGLNYTPNPVTPYSEASKQKDVVDFLQFPRETFQYRAGDCSDISILYGALLQAIGIDAAFITVPGHIFIAVDTNLTPEQAPRELIPAGQFIAYKGKAWLPVEITSVHDGFVKAWQLGAKEWNENNPSGQAGFYPIQDAWTAYQPVGLPGAETTINVPQSDRILLAYRKEVQKFLDAAIGPMIATLQGQIRTTGSLAAMNSLGVLYAKYGQIDNAEKQFRLVLVKKPYLPTILNLGHLYFARGDWKNALASYQQASDMDPGNPRTILALARANQELQNYADAKKNYEKLKTINPGLASEFAYLGESTGAGAGTGTSAGARAADVASARAVILWENDQ
jgi:tetratricopeptide (TPR) repeat protein